MGRIFLHHCGGARLYSCANCDCVLTNRTELVSSRFNGSTGRAYLFRTAVNLYTNEVQERVSGRIFRMNIQQYFNWLVGGAIRWCWLADTLCAMSSAKNAQPNSAGCTSSPWRIRRNTKRETSYWSAHWSPKATVFRLRLNPESWECK